MTWHRVVIGIVIAVAVASGAAEMGLRFTKTKYRLRHHLHLAEDPVLHHRILPDATTTVRGVPFTTNSLGLKDREILPQKGAGVFRILMLGDSFTEGFGLPIDGTPAKIVEGLLNATAGCRGRYEVVNAGVSSYSPILYYLWLERLWHLGPDLVVLNFDMTDVHDDWVRTRLARLDHERLPIAVPANPVRERGVIMLPMTKPALFGFLTPVERLLGQSAVYQELRTSTLVQRVAGSARPGQHRLEALGLVGDVQYDAMAITRDEEPRRLGEAWALTERYLGAILRRAVAQHIPLVLVVYPWAHQVSATASPIGRWRFDLAPRLYASERPFALLEEFGRRRGVPVVNLLSLFREHAQRGAVLFHEEDVHHTPAGARLLAQGIVAGLARHEALPCR